MIDRVCKTCSKLFRISACRLKEGNRGVYCSRKCFTDDRIGKHSMENNPNWKGGKKRPKSGYIMVRVENNKYQLEHRFVAEKIIGRKLLKHEVVHHINGVKNDNRPENLVVLKNRAEHSKTHHEHLVKCPTCGRFMPKGQRTRGDGNVLHD